METLYAIPGLGTDKELYRNLSISGYQLKILDWPLPEKNLSLGEYASRFLPQIDASKPVILLGVSFGGMLCAELAEQIKTKKVFLISSCRNRDDFPGTLKILKYIRLHKLFPDKAVRLLAKNKRKFLGFEKSFEPVFYQMIDRMPKNYFSYCVNYIINWERRSNNADIIQIHGSSDKLLYKKGEFLYTIKNGSHSMVLNRTDEINTILNKELNGL